VTRAEILTWLGERRPPPPAALRERLHSAVHDAPLELAAHLAQLGGELLENVTSRPEGGRELALDLLAADAFTTYAFEAQAEEGTLHGS
jgi:hypothetical protein